MSNIGLLQTAVHSNIYFPVDTNGIYLVSFGEFEMLHQLPVLFSNDYLCADISNKFYFLTEISKENIFSVFLCHQIYEKISLKF